MLVAAGFVVAVVFHPVLSPFLLSSRTVSRKLLGFQRITGVSRSSTFKEDLSDCLYVGTHPKSTFSNRRDLQCSEELCSICKSVCELQRIFVCIKNICGADLGK